jgi:c-di-GMP-binding flagellar brake protein YcgR
MEPPSNQRNFFRVQYPVTVRPTLESNGKALTVTELSEGGMRVAGGDRLEVGTEVSGTLRLACGETLEISARVHRVQADEHVLVDLVGLSFPSVMREQQHLIATCPGYGRSRS